MIKKHKTFSGFALAILLAIPCMVLFSGCGDDTLKNLTNAETGIEVTGGKFEKGSKLSVEKIEMTSQAGQEALARVSSSSYNTTKDPVIYDIKVTKDDSVIQPKGEITITTNAPFESENGYIVFHIIDQNNVETLDATFANGKISFKVTHFSIFIIAEDL